MEKANPTVEKRLRILEARESLIQMLYTAVAQCYFEQTPNLLWRQPSDRAHTGPISDFSLFLPTSLCLFFPSLSLPFGPTLTAPHSRCKRNSPLQPPTHSPLPTPQLPCLPPHNPNGAGPSACSTPHHHSFPPSVPEAQTHSDGTLSSAVARAGDKTLSP